MINLQKFKQKIKDLYSNEHPMIREVSNGYKLFDKYVIIKDNDEYKLYKNNEYMATVSLSRSAVSWCVADEQRDWQLANEIVRLDRLVAGKQFDIEVHKIQSSKGKKDKRELHQDLYLDSLIRLKAAKANLDNCINLTKYSNKIKDLNK